MKGKLKNIGIVFLPVLIVTGLLIFADSFSGITGKGDTEVCLSCHEDKDLTMDKGGKKVSLFVDAAHYKNSVHQMAECEDCHENYNPDEIPHTKSKQEVNCFGCHNEARNIEANVHAKVKCFDCHSKHEVRPAKEFAKDQVKACFSCHKNQTIQHYSESVHAKNNVTCENCHNGGHNVKKITKPEVSDLRQVSWGS